MKELMIAMMVWLSGATGYEIPELPAIKFLQPLELKSYAWGCEKVPIPKTSVDTCNSKDTWDEETNSPLGLYDFETKTIILREGFDINTVHDKSILLHELAHLSEMNHSVRFWTLLDHYDPLRVVHEAELDQISAQLMRVGRY